MPIFNLYGMSETTGAFNYMCPNKFSLTTSGYTIPGLDLLINNPDENGEGEICMRGRSMMMGYLKNEKATIDTINGQGYIMSGDKGKVSKEGFLMITGIWWSRDPLLNRFVFG